MFFYRLEGSRTLRGQRPLRKRLIIVFRAVVRSPVPKCKAFGWTSNADAKHMPTRHRHQKNNYSSSEGWLFFYRLEGSRTLRGQRPLRKRLIIVFRAVVRSPVPKCKAFGWTSNADAKHMPTRHRHQKNNYSSSEGWLFFIVRRESNPYVAQP